MATDGPTPADCDREIYERGDVLGVTHTIPPNALEGWVRKVAALSGQRLDWHYVGGRAVVKMLGDRAKAEAAVAALRPELDRLFRETMRERFPAAFDERQAAPWYGMS